MNKDYLFDKTGEDAEIENLENLLQGFRRKNTTAPRLPVKVMVFPNKTRQKTFKYAFAIAASLLITFMLGLFALNIGKKDVQNDNLSENNAPQTFKSIPEEQKTVPQTILTAPEDKNNAPQVFKTTLQKKNTTLQKFKTALQEKSIAPEKILTAQNVNKYALAKQKSVKTIPQIKVKTLTDEEKFAYEQLKLALSITGSKLKIVKEKIYNAEDFNSVVNKKTVTK
jgi:hypothetical protein